MSMSIIHISDEGRDLKKELENYLKSKQPYKSIISKFRVDVVKVNYPYLRPISYVVNVIHAERPLTVEERFDKYNELKVFWIINQP